VSHTGPVDWDLAALSNCAKVQPPTHHISNISDSGLLWTDWHRLVYLSTPADDDGDAADLVLSPVPPSACKFCVLTPPFSLHGFSYLNPSGLRSPILSLPVHAHFAAYVAFFAPSSDFAPSMSVFFRVLLLLLLGGTLLLPLAA